MAHFDAVVFDFDGTLIDSAPIIARVLNALLTDIGRPSLSVPEVIQLIGDGTPALLRRALAATGPTVDADDFAPLLDRYRDMQEAAPPGPETIYPGVIETLDRLSAKGVALGLCTNKPFAVTLATLDAIGLAGRFGAVIGGDSLPQRKPEPEPLRAVIDTLGAAVGRSVMVGDNANDVATARALGIPVVAVSYGYPRMPLADLGADLIIDRFADLLPALDRLTAPVS
ncbi:MAG: phosphoglycolate phosphatase [Inquilinaceae bacterium]